MARVVVFSEWHFEEGERAVVRWFRSPYRGPNKQWMLPVVLRGRRSGLITHTVPWGVLALLRLGQVYVDGAPVGVQGIETTLTVTSAPDLVEAAAALPAQFYPLRNRENLAERCFVFSTSEDVQLVLLALEGIRALLAFNKALLLGLIGTNYPNLIVRKHEVVGDALRLDFSTKLEDTGLLGDVGFIRHVARLLYDPSFTTAWGTVWHRRRLEERQRPSEAIPLSFEFPGLTQEWQVRGFEGKDVFLALELLRVTPEVALPFSRIIYHHPNLQRPKIIMTDRPTRTERPKRTTTVVESEPKSASRRERIYMPMEGSALDEPEELDVAQEKAEGTTERDPVLVTAVPDSDPEVVTLADTGTQTQVKAGEITQPRKGKKKPSEEGNEDDGDEPPLEKLSDDERLDSFSKFLRVVEKLKEKLGRGRVGQSLYLVPQNIPFGTVQERPRRFLLVAMKLSRGVVYLIEVEAPDERRISNVMFCARESGSPVAVEKVLGKLMGEVLAPRGWWQLAELRTFEDEMELYVARVRHSSVSVESRASRLIAVAENLSYKGG